MDELMITDCSGILRGRDRQGEREELVLVGQQDNLTNSESNCMTIRISRRSFWYILYAIVQARLVYNYKFDTFLICHYTT